MKEQSMYLDPLRPSSSNSGGRSLGPYYQAVGLAELIIPLSMTITTHTARNHRTLTRPRADGTRTWYSAYPGLYSTTQTQIPESNGRAHVEHRNGADPGKPQSRKVSSPSREPFVKCQRSASPRHARSGFASDWLITIRSYRDRCILLCEIVVS